MTRTYQQHPWLVMGALIFAFVTFHGSSHAQAPEREIAVALVGGPMEYDLSGVGTSAFAAVRVDVPLSRHVLLEPGLTFAWYDAQFDTRVSLLFPEVQLQVSGASRFAPFLGVGAGPALAWGGGSSDTDVHLTGGVGFRVRMTSAWRARAEMRVRAVNPFAGTIVEFGFGIGRSF